VEDDQMIALWDLLKENLRTASLVKVAFTMFLVHRTS
jgi:hypothetical protein